MNTKVSILIWIFILLVSPIALWGATGGFDFDQLQDIATGTILGRNTSGTGDIEAIASSTVATMLDTLQAGNNLSDLSSTSTAVTNLVLAIGTDTQAWDAGLDDIAALAVTDSNFIVGNGTNWVAESGATVRTSLGLAIGTNVQAWDVNLDEIAGFSPTTGNLIVGSSTEWTVVGVGAAGTFLGASSTAPGGLDWLTPAGTGDVTAASNLEDLSIIIGDGGAKGVKNTGVFLIDGNVASGTVIDTASNTITIVEADISDLGSYLVTTNNLSDLNSSSTARTNLGLAVGTDVQAWDADLDIFAALDKTQGNLIAASGTWVVVPKGTDGQALIASSTDPTGYDFIDLAAGSGDVSSVGDCATGACLDGTSDGGTYIRLYDGDSNHAEFLVPNIAATTFYTFPSAASSTIMAGENNLTDLSATSTAIGNLGLTIGADVQAWDNDLDDIAALTPTKGNLLAGNGTDWVALTVGADDKVLAASSTAASGLWWAEDANSGGAAASTTLDTIETSGASSTTDIDHFFWTVAGVNSSSTLVVDGQDGQVGIRVANPSVALEVDGTASSTDVAVSNDILLSTGSIIDFAAADITLTHSANALTFAGGTMAFGANSVTGSNFTITGGSITGITDLTVADGGTGVSTLTDGGVLLGSGTGAVTAMAVLADGEFIVGDGTTDPVAESGATVRTSLGLGTAATQNISALSGTWDFSAASTTLPVISTGVWESTDIGVAFGGTGVSTLTDGGVLIGSGTGAITALTVGTNGQLLIGSTGADPVFATLNCADYLTCTTGAGTLEIDVDAEIAQRTIISDWSSDGFTASSTNFADIDNAITISEVGCYGGANASGTIQIEWRSQNTPTTASSTNILTSELSSGGGTPASSTTLTTSVIDADSVLAFVLVDASSTQAHPDFHHCWLHFSVND